MIYLSWAINTYGLTRVDFYFSQSGLGMPAFVIGSDTYFGDGVSITWAVTPGISGTLTAIGYSGGRQSKATAAATFVFTNNPPTQMPPPVIIGTALSISPFTQVNNNVYQLPPDQLITISWPSTFPTATDRVVFELIPAGGGQPQAMGIDTNLGDGASIIWRAVDETQGTMRAVAYFSGGYGPQYSDSYYIIVKATPPVLFDDSSVPPSDGGSGGDVIPPGDGGGIPPEETPIPF